MEKIGKFNLLSENECSLGCDCGWNIAVGGYDEEDLVLIKEFLRKLK